MIQIPIRWGRPYPARHRPGDVRHVYFHRGGRERRGGPERILGHKRRLLLRRRKENRITRNQKNELNKTKQRKANLHRKRREVAGGNIEEKDLMTWHSLSPAAQETFLFTLAWWWWRTTCGSLFCSIWSAGSPISGGPPKPGGKEAVAIAATNPDNLSLCLSLCPLLFSQIHYLCIKKDQYCTVSSQIFSAQERWP